MEFCRRSLGTRLALIFSFIGILLLSVNGFAQDDTMINIPNVMDPVKAEVLGVHLHMTGKEAVAALEQRLHIKIPPKPTSLSNSYINMSKTTMTPGKMFLSAIRIYSDQFGLNLFFSESYPFNVDRPESLTSITYSPFTQTEADGTAFEAHLLQKYGPGLMVGGHPTLTWCATGHAWPSEVKGQLNYSCLNGVDGAHPYMHGDQNGLSVIDESIAHKNYELWNATKITSAPPLQTFVPYCGECADILVELGKDFSGRRGAGQDLAYTFEAAGLGEVVESPATYRRSAVHFNEMDSPDLVELEIHKNAVHGGGLKELLRVEHSNVLIPHVADVRVGSVDLEPFVLVLQFECSGSNVWPVSGDSHQR